MNDSIGDFIRWIRQHKYLFTTIAFLAIMVLFDENNLLKHIQNQREIAVLKSDIEELQEQYDELVKQLDKFDSDVDVMEKIARDRYGMHLEDEDVFIVED